MTLTTPGFDNHFHFCKCQAKMLRPASKTHTPKLVQSLHLTISKCLTPNFCRIRSVSVSQDSIEQAFHY